MTYKADRRDNDRRREKEFVEFPFLDANGVEIKCDRRKKEDRRSKMIITSESISDTEFNEYFLPKD
jgi:hypothetical protein